MPGEPQAPAAAVPPAPDQVLWVLTKGRHCAELAARTHRVGVELRVSVDGSLILSEVVRPFDGKDVRGVAEQHRAAFLGRGWIGPKWPFTGQS